MAPAWWTPADFDDWDESPSAGGWLQRTLDLPQPEQIVSVTNPKDGSKWLNLNAFSIWQQPKPLGERLYESPTKEVWIMLRGYIVHKKDSDKLVRWAQQQSFAGDWMPHPSGDTQIFLREFFWSPAFEYHNDPYYHRNGWTDRGFGKGRCIPGKVLCAVDEYYRENNTYDCSVDETVRFFIPCKWLTEKMGLIMGPNDGLFCKPDGQLITYDPSIVESGPSCLLVRKEPLEAFMNKGGYTLFWTLAGEKNIYHEPGSHDPSKRYGFLRMHGGYSLKDGKIVGAFGSQFTAL
jgi:hypothetical protein